MSESPPHVPQPFPYSFPGPNPIAAKANASAIIQRFALSSSRKPVTESSKRSRSSNGSSSDESSSDEELEDPCSLQEPDRVDGAPSASSSGVELEENNIGMRMLMKLGWSQGKGLGKDLQGRTQPIDPQASVGMMGLGKATQDSRMMDKVIESASGPRELASQKMAKETEDQKKARMAKAAHMEAVQTSIAATLKSFHCEICDKKYANVGQYDEVILPPVLLATSSDLDMLAQHTNSYDHHHRARAVATKAADLARLKATGESDKRREKERKREAKDMAKIMGAAGVPVPMTKVPIGAEIKKVEDKPKKAGGWAKVGGGGFGSSNASPSLSAVPGAPKSSGWTSITSLDSATTSTEPSSAPLPRSNPAFKSGGIFTLSDLYDTPSLANSIAPQPLTAPPPPPPSHSVPPPPDSTYRPPPPPPPSHSIPPPPPSTYRATPPPPPHSRSPPPPPQYIVSSQPSRSKLPPLEAVAPLRATFEMHESRMNTSSYSQQASSSRDPTNSRVSYQSRELLPSRNDSFDNPPIEQLPRHQARRPSPPTRDSRREDSGRSRSRSRSRSKSRSRSSSFSSRSRSRSRSPVRRQRSRSPPRRDRINNSRSGQSIYQGQGGRDSYQGGGRNDRNTGGRQERGEYGDRSRNGPTRGGYGEEHYRR